MNVIKDFIYKGKREKGASKTEISLRKFGKLREFHDRQEVHYGTGISLGLLFWR